MAEGAASGAVATTVTATDADDPATSDNGVIAYSITGNRTMRARFGTLAAVYLVMNTKT